MTWRERIVMRSYAKVVLASAKTSLHPANRLRLTTTKHNTYMKNYYSYIIIIALASIGLVSSQHTFANPEGAGPKSETKQVTVTLSKEQEGRYNAAVKKAGGPRGAEPMLCD